jgi:segregation and condensation protein B
MPSLELTIEAILFAAGNRISLSRIMELAKQSDKNQILAILESLEKKYSAPDSSFSLSHIGDDWKLTVKQEFLPIVEKIAPDTELPKGIIETLAVVAWKSPVSQAEVIRIRSTKGYDHIEELVNRGFIDKEKQGRSFTIKLTPKFFEYFDISSKEPIDSAVVSIKQRLPVPIQESKSLSQEQPDQPIIIPEQIALSELKKEEREKQKTFLESIDSQLMQVSQKTTQVQSEINELKPKDVVESQPAVSATEQQSQENAVDDSTSAKKPIDNE